MNRVKNCRVSWLTDCKATPKGAGVHGACMNQERVAGLNEISQNLCTLLIHVKMPLSKSHIISNSNTLFLVKISLINFVSRRILITPRLLPLHAQWACKASQSVLWAQQMREKRYHRGTVETSLHSANAQLRHQLVFTLWPLA